MKWIAAAVIACASVAFAAPASAQTNEDIAKAYIQAITGGSKAKVAGAIDFTALGCEPSTAFDEGRCQKIVKDGKDGKTLLMESITEGNVGDLVPAEDAKRVFAHYGDPTYSATRMMLFNLSTNGNGFLTRFDGKGKPKAILQAYLEGLGSKGMYGYLDLPFNAVPGPEAQMTAVGVSLRFNTLPSAKEREKMAGTLYFWALQANFSPMEFPADFVPTGAVGGLAGKDCKKTTAAWGHIGFQLHKDGLQRVNWGGGGGKADYGCGGSDLTTTPFELGLWYEYRIVRGERLGPKLWLWMGEVYNEKTGVRIYQKSIYGGEYLNGAMTWIETFNRACADPKVSTEWKGPWVGAFDAKNQLKKYRVGRVNLTLPGDSCFRSRQDIVSTCKAEWRQEVGAVWKKTADGSPAPPDPAQESDLRPIVVDGLRLEERYCERAPDETEMDIASAYVDAISSGAPRIAPGPVDYDKLGCTAATVLDPKKCEANVFNGQNGQTVLMNAITPAKGDDWRTSNISRLIPEDAMRRILTDPRFAKVKQLFDSLSAPNDTYPWLAKPGMAKDVLRQYMASVR